MNLRARSYDRIALITVTGAITAPEFKILEEDLVRLARAYDFVIVTLSKAVMEDGMLMRLTNTRNSLSLRKLWFVHSGSKTADFPTTSDALKATEIPIAIRVAQTRILQKQVHNLTEQFEIKQIEFSDTLRRGLSEPETGTVLTDEEWEAKQEAVIDELTRLRIIFKTLSAPIESISKEVARLQSKEKANPESVAKVREAKAAAISALRNTGIISDGKSK